MKIALIPGHTATSQGASHGNVSEYGLSSTVIGSLVFKLTKAGHTAFLIGHGSNSSQADAVNKLDCDFGLELHFNSHSDKSMNGTETLYSGSATGHGLANAINSSLSALLHTRDRGCHVGHYQLDPEKPLITIIKNTNPTFVVVEPLFLSNEKDRGKIDIELISTGIFEGILDYIGVV